MHLQKLQNDVIRFIFYISKYLLDKESHTLEKNSTGSPSLPEYYLTVYLALHHMIPDYISNCIHHNTTKHPQIALNKYKLQTKVLIYLSSPQLKAFSMHDTLTRNKLPLPTFNFIDFSFQNLKYSFFLFVTPLINKLNKN